MTNNACCTTPRAARRRIPARRQTVNFSGSCAGPGWPRATARQAARQRPSAFRLSARYRSGRGKLAHGLALSSETEINYSAIGPVRGLCWKFDVGEKFRRWRLTIFDSGFRDEVHSFPARAALLLLRMHQYGIHELDVAEDRRRDRVAALGAAPSASAITSVGVC